jgi:hypothetical protein
MDWFSSFLQLFPYDSRIHAFLFDGLTPGIRCFRVPASWTIRPTSDPNFNCPIPYQWIGLRETNYRKAVDLCLIYHWGCLFQFKPCQRASKPVFLCFFSSIFNILQNIQRSHPYLVLHPRNRHWVTPRCNWNLTRPELGWTFTHQLSKIVQV